MMLPVVATDTGSGTVEAFRPGASGLLIPRCDTQALVSAINLLAASERRRVEMGTVGRAFVEGEHSYAALAAKLGPVYERVAEDEGRRSADAKELSRAGLVGTRA